MIQSPLLNNEGPALPKEQCHLTNAMAQESLWAEEIAQRLETWAALSEDPDWIPSTHTSSRESDILSGFCGHSYTRYSQTCRQNTCTHLKNTNNNKTSSSKSSENYRLSESVTLDPKSLTPSSRVVPLLHQ